jgi:Family of unknown function (DUF5763)
MKLFAVCSLSLLLFSCYHNGSDREEIDRLKQRIISLEQKVDALTNSSTVPPNGFSKRNSSGTSSYSAPVSSNRCLALTKKGSQCKRKAKGNGYCWQHGG